MRSHIAVVVVLVAALAAPASADTRANAICPAPTQLSCELLTSPQETVIYDPQPELAWVCGTGDAAYRQSAYRIVVEDASEPAGPRRVVWDTGKVAGNQSVNVQYAGQPLAAQRSYEWKVRTWNTDGVGSEWSAPQTFRMARRLSEHRTSRYRVRELPHEAQSVSRLPDGDYFVDFGAAAFGHVTLKVPPADAERALAVRFGEKLRQGRIDRKPGGSIRYYAVAATVPAGAGEIAVRPPRDRRNTSGAAIRLPESIGVIAPFRYVEVRGLPAGLGQANFVERRVEYQFDDSASSFESSNPTLDAVWRLCKYSIRATTFCGIYVDGDRERIPYEADAYINQLAHYGVDREYALARHSHEYLLTHPTWPTEWKQHSVLMAWEDYLYTGDRESLVRNYELLKREKVLLAAELPSGLVDTSAGEYRDIVDWPAGQRDGFEMRPVNTVVNAFHYATLVRMAKMAAITGHQDDAERFTRKAETYCTVFNETFWSPENEAYVDGAGSTHSSIHANLFPLAFGLVPPERVPAVTAFLRARRMVCSVYAAHYLLQGLYQHDQHEYALELLASRGKRSWYNMLRSGSTITLEAWDRQFKPNLDWNHAWGAAPAYFIPAYLVGVRPLEPGFEQVVIEPRPGDLKHFAARVPSVRGSIDVRYARSPDGCRLEILVPGNCTARVGAPVSHDAHSVTLVWNDREVRLKLAGRHAWIDDVPPGRHTVVLTEVSPTAAQTANREGEAGLPAR